MFFFFMAWEDRGVPNSSTARAMVVVVVVVFAWLFRIRAEVSCYAEHDLAKKIT